MPEDQIKHLEFIQNTITRMAQNSFAMKGWAVALVSAVLVAAHEIAGWPYLAVAAFPALMFWGLDAYYLRLERLFRLLYDEVRMQSEADWLADLFNFKYKPAKGEHQTWLRICFSESVVWLYLPMLVLIGVMTLFASQYELQRECDNNGKESILQLPFREGQLESRPDSQSLDYQAR